MQEHKLMELNKIIEERIGSLREEVEIATNVKLNPLYIIELKDEIVSLRWTTRIIRWILDRAIDGQQQLGITKKRLELEDTKKFENMLDEKIQELEIELEDSNTDREEEILEKEIGTLKCVLGHLFNLKSSSDEIRAIEIGGVNNKFQQTNHEREQLVKRQDLETKISAQIQTRNCLSIEL
jgi:hypothetical protein